MSSYSDTYTSVVIPALQQGNGTGLDSHQQMIGHIWHTPHTNVGIYSAVRNYGIMIVKESE